MPKPLHYPCYTQVTLNININIMTTTQSKLNHFKGIMDICERLARLDNEVGETCREYLESVDAQLCLDASDQDMLEDMEGVFIKDLGYAILNTLKLN